MKHALLIKILNVSKVVLFTLVWSLSYRFKLLEQCNLFTLFCYEPKKCTQKIKTNFHYRIGFDDKCKQINRTATKINLIN